MSVESQLGDAPGNAIPQPQLEKQEPSTVKQETIAADVGEDAETHSSSHSEVADDTCLTESVTESMEIGDDGATKSEAKKWFESISSEERVLAMGFTDGPFLATLLSFSSWPSDLELLSGGIADVGNRIDWGKMVSLRDVETTYSMWETMWEKRLGYVEILSCSGVQEKKSETTLREYGQAEQNAQADGNENEKTQGLSGNEQDLSGKDVGEGPFESDALRIRGEQGSDSLIAKGEVLATVADSVAVVKEAGGVQPHSIFLSNSMFDYVCVVFPSAFKHVSGKCVDEQTPYVTLHPSFVENVSEEELFLLLDELSRSVFDASFLSVSSGYSRRSRIPNNWVERLRHDDLLATGKREGHVPLYSLLLARFEVAIFNAHRAHVGKSHHQVHAVAFEMNHKPHKMHPTQTGEGDSSLDQFASAHGTEASGGERTSKEDSTAADLFVSAHGTETEFINEERAHAETDLDARRSACDLVRDLISHVQAMDDLAVTIDIATLSDFMSPFVKACFGEETSVSSSKLEKMMLTPLAWLSMQKESGSGIDFGAFDNALATSLRRMKEHGSPQNVEEDAPGPRDDKEVQVLSNSGEGEPVEVVSSETILIEIGDAPAASKKASVQAGGGGGGKKKKKKNKKKKKCKGQNTQFMNVHTDNASPTPAADQTVNGSTEDEKERIEPAVESESLMQDHSEKNQASTAPESVDVEIPMQEETAEDNQQEQTGDVDATDSASVRSDASSTDDAVALAKVSVDDFKVQRVDGLLLVAAPVTEFKATTTLSDDTAEPADNVNAQSDDGDAWETVEVRGRGSRKKVERSHGQKHSQTSAIGLSASTESQNGTKKTKVRTSMSRKRNATRKIVRDILSLVLDSVDEEVRKRKAVAAAATAAAAATQKAPSAVAANPWKKGPPAVVKPATVTRIETKIEPPPPVVKKATLRDVVLGKHTTTNKPVVAPPVPPSATKKQADKQPEMLRDKQPDKQPETQAPKVPEKQPEKQPETQLEKGSSTKGYEKSNPPTVAKKVSDSSAKSISPKRTKVPLTADQNTAPTYQETISAISGASNVVADEKREPIFVERAEKSDSSSGDTNEVPQNRVRVLLSPAGKDSSPAPPLPTLLSPESANSATSSVASSLEVPHTRHHSSATSDVNDVGYHLLDVCDRLSRDMSLFMSRRSQALNTRRRERGALLAALQDTVGNIWPSRCQVELYGSCATMLDLPSSDLDVVVIGLDRSADVVGSHASIDLSKSFGSETLSSCASVDQKGEEGQQQQATHVPQHPPIPPMHYVPVPPYMHLNVNGERVLRLAAELEPQPWAVHINAIPTAAVPVIKILADPSRLTGSAPAAEWMMQHHVLPPDDPTVQPNLQHIYQPWRGADVMNGLLSLDITFEGPEHGGLGSTEYSLQVVSEVCHESGLPPDGTPFVQVLMVLKELLAQRKLNEPYSGGLSSYALLLLLVALCRERTVIRQEIEREERQRQAVAAGDVNPAFVTPFPTDGASVSDARSEASSIADGSAKPAYKSSGHEHPVQTRKSNSSSANVGHRHAKRADLPGPRVHHDKKGKNHVDPPVQSKQQDLSSWATIAKKQSAPQSFKSKSAKDNQAPPLGARTLPKADSKPTSFADAVAKSMPSRGSNVSISSGRDQKNAWTPANATTDINKQEPKASTAGVTKTPPESSDSIKQEPETPAVVGASASTIASTNTSLAAPSYFPQGYNDVIEVLCSGETTAGKLLMHFLLYYGQHFDAHGTAIDVSGKHERDYSGQYPYSYLSPYIQRRAQGRIDPITGMLTVDPIVVYDPLEGAEYNNVARRCFAWNSVRWIFAQSYSTLSSAVERSASPPATPGGPTGKAQSGASSVDGSNRDGDSQYYPDAVGDIMDPSSPLLRCLLSF